MKTLYPSIEALLIDPQMALINKRISTIPSSQAPSSRMRQLINTFKQVIAAEWASLTDEMMCRPRSLGYDDVSYMISARSKEPV